MRSECHDPVPVLCARCHLETRDRIPHQGPLIPSRRSRPDPTRPRPLLGHAVLMPCPSDPYHSLILGRVMVGLGIRSSVAYPSPAHPTCRGFASLLGPYRVPHHRHSYAVSQARAVSAQYAVCSTHTHHHSPFRSGYTSRFPPRLHTGCILHACSVSSIRSMCSV